LPDEQAGRTPSGHARPSHPSHARASAAARRRHRRPSRAGHQGVFVVGPGSLFPALHRLADRGWIEGEWGELETGRRAKFYAITPAGRKRLAEEKRNWTRVSIAVNQVLAEES